MKSRSNEFKIKFAIVGCGSIGKRHLAVLDSEEEAEIVAICDSVEERVKELSNLYNGILKHLLLFKNVGRDRRRCHQCGYATICMHLWRLKRLTKGLMFWVEKHGA
ncbi:MAG: Gfo/Idh/MocA family oxidoreductase [Sphingobacteriaceae bacterium]|nr:Gfo/Idh/MocA family oxidoreductase [Sphingobacteriaceae bacterium]